MKVLLIIIPSIIVYILLIWYINIKEQDFNNEYRKELGKIYKKQAKFYKELCDVIDEIRKYQKENK